jgi:hypothetical protein
VRREQPEPANTSSEDRWRWCEYIAFRGLWRVAYARLDESDISDTELQVIIFAESS